MSLRVLHISETDAGGGSARSAFRIHSGLLALGHESRMLVGRRQTDSPDVRPLKRSLAWRGADRVGSAAEVLSLQSFAYPSSFGVARDPWFRSADVLQLYNLHGSYFGFSALPALTRRRPSVWRLSDMWAVTGHVAYSYDCERWRSGCGRCPYLGEYPALRRDTTALLWRAKRAVYARSRLTVVAPSRWLEEVACSSPLLSRFRIERIPNGVDLETFRPGRAEARRLLGLDPERPAILFTSLDLRDRRKGGHVLAEALGRLADLDFDLLVAGAGELPLPRPARALGRLDGNEALAVAYAAADLFVLPALAENLPNSVVESLACGTPVVAFEVGGVPDAVRHLETGYLAPLGDAEGLASGIRLLLFEAELRRRLGEEARSLAEREFGAVLEARRFADLYADVLGR